MKGFDIIIHTGLKDNPVAVVLRELGVDVKYITLRQGEFVLSPEVGIKYMTRADYLNGIKNRSIYRDIIELKREYEKPIIIIEEDEQSSAPGVDMTQIQTAVLFISVLNRIPILFTNGEIETARMIFMMSAQPGPETNATSPNGIAEEKESAEGIEVKGDLRKFIVEKLPDVGPGLAQALIKHFGSLARLFSAGKKDLMKVDGIGPKKAQAIHAFLNLKTEN